MKDIEQTLEALDRAVEYPWTWNGGRQSDFDAAVLQVLRDALPALIAAHEALIRLGRSSAEAIAGSLEPDELPNTVKQCVAAIEAEQALGRERNDEANALRADAEAYRKMKEAGPVAWANVDRYGDHHYYGINQLPQGRHHLYALPDTKKDVITEYYTDRQNSGLSPLEAHR